MRIELRIDNYDQLPDGGPVVFSAENRTFEIGRDSYRDWTLPDDDRFISGRHCEIRYDAGLFYLNDVSRNGTYVNGGEHRVKDRHLLNDGDKVQIGPYIVAVSIADDPDLAAGPGLASAGGADGIWDFGGPTPAAEDRRQFMPARERPRRGVESDHIDLPVFRKMPDAAPPQGEVFFEPTPSGSSAVDAYDRSSDSPFANPGLAGQSAQTPPRRLQMQAAPAAEALPLPRDIPNRSQPRQQGAAAGISQASGFVEALALAAGIAPQSLHGRSGAELGHEIGTILREVTEELSALLKARAAAKAMARADRTMISAQDNNPLKFLPTASDALQIMFSHNRPGYLGARESFQQAFSDLKSHELATYAAMQKALAKLLEGLSPDAIEAKASGSVLASRKSRAWDIFVDRWEAKSEPYENGMLDVYLAYFAEAYNAATQNKPER